MMRDSLELDATDEVMLEVARKLLQGAQDDIRGAEDGHVYRLRDLHQKLEAAAVIGHTVYERHQRAKLAGWPKKRKRPFFSPSSLLPKAALKWLRHSAEVLS